MLIICYNPTKEEATGNYLYDSECDALDSRLIKIRRISMTKEDEVRKASEQFYTALNRMVNGDASSLDDIWSHSPTVTTMHPIGGRQLGWKNVYESFKQVAQLASEGQVKLGDQLIQVFGDIAYELGVENGQARLAGDKITINQRVTNIYRREPGGWKIVHHHTDVSQAMLTVLSHIKTGTMTKGG
jgi:ketosteroid isomerase-like protein